MTDPNEQYAYFTIAGDFDPHAISQQLDTAPTESWTKGDVNPKTQLERKFSRWSLYSRLDRSCTLEDHMADVLKQLTARKPQFIEVSSKHGGVMQLVAYFKTGYPGLNLDRDLLQSLGEFALSLDFDFYYLYSDSREDS